MFRGALSGLSNIFGSRQVNRTFCLLDFFGIKQEVKELLIQNGIEVYTPKDKPCNRKQCYAVWLPVPSDPWHGREFNLPNLGWSTGESVRWVLTSTTYVPVLKPKRRFRKAEVISLQGMDLRGIKASSQHTLYLILRSLAPDSRLVEPGIELSRARIGFIARRDGRIYNQVSRWLYALGVPHKNIFLFDKFATRCFPTKEKQLEDGHFKQGAIDVLVCAMPATHETYHCVGEQIFRELDDCSKEYSIVNIARDDVIDWEALSRRMPLGKVKRYIADFRPPWYLEENYREQIQYTPHVGGYYEPSYTEAQKMVAMKFIEAVGSP